MPLLTVKQLIEELSNLPETAILIDDENRDFAVGSIKYDKELDECLVIFQSKD